MLTTVRAAPPERVRRRLNPEARCQQIVECASQFIAEFGYRALTFKAVADRCGMTAPGVMHYFPSTTALLEGVLDHYTLVLRRRVRLVADNGLGARACLDEVVRDVWEWPVFIRLYVHLSAESTDHGHAAREYLLKRHDMAINLVARLIGDAHPDPVWAAEVFYTTLDGLRMRWIRDPSLDALAEWRRVADVMYAGTMLSHGNTKGGRNANSHATAPAEDQAAPALRTREDGRAT
jgi:AcrR family transcriptional regulator